MNVESLFGALSVETYECLDEWYSGYEGAVGSLCYERGFTLKNCHKEWILQIEMFRRILKMSHTRISNFPTRVQQVL